MGNILLLPCLLCCSFLCACLNRVNMPSSPNPHLPAPSPNASEEPPRCTGFQPVVESLFAVIPQTLRKPPHPTQPPRLRTVFHLRATRCDAADGGNICDTLAEKNDSCATGKRAANSLRARRRRRKLLRQIPPRCPCCVSEVRSRCSPLRFHRNEEAWSGKLRTEKTIKKWLRNKSSGIAPLS